MACSWKNVEMMLGKCFDYKRKRYIDLPTLFMKGDIYGDYTFEGGRNNHHFPNCRKKDQTPGFFAGH